MLIVRIAQIVFVQGVCGIIMDEMRSLSLSLIIPAYNESQYIDACLESIARQTVQPLEVLVVDNNSSDDTVAVASRYPFVTILRETRQHQVYAQAAGFDAARGDVLGRIDADTILPNDWVERVCAHFQAHPSVMAVSGGARPYDVFFTGLGAAIFSLYHQKAARLATGRTMILGANCALRAAAWPDVRSTMHFRADLWEDYDMAFHLPRGSVVQLPGLMVSMSFRAAHKKFVDVFRYQLRGFRTVGLHVSRLRAAFFTALRLTAIVWYPVVLVDNVLLRMRAASGGRMQPLDAYSKSSASPKPRK